MARGKECVVICDKCGQPYIKEFPKESMSITIQQWDDEKNPLPELCLEICHKCAKKFNKWFKLDG